MGIKLKFKQKHTNLFKFNPFHKSVIKMKFLINGIIAGIAIIIINMIANQAMGFAMPSLYNEYNSMIFRPWSDPLMSLFFVYELVLGIALAWTWQIIKPILKSKNKFENTFNFAVSFWAITSIPGMLAT